jgi:hypothetical protein
MNLHLFRYRRLLRHPRFQGYAVRDLSMSGDLDRRLGPNRFGWHPAQGTVFRRTDLAASEVVAERWYTPETVMSAIGDTVDRALGAGSEVILLIPPHAPRFRDRMSEPELDWTTFIEAMNHLATSRGVALIDHHAHPDFGDEAFFDGIHLRNEEAQRYSGVLGRTLSAVRPDATPSARGATKAGASSGASGRSEN